MGLFGFVGSVVKGVATGVACVAAAPVLVAASVAVEATEKVIIPVGKGVFKIGTALAKEILRDAARKTADAYPYIQRGDNMSDPDLINAYKNANSEAERNGYAIAWTKRHGNA